MQPAWTPNDRELPAPGAASFIFRHVLVLESSFLHCPKPAFICWCLYQLLTSVKKPSSFILEIQRRLSIRGNSSGFLVCSPQGTFLDCSRSRCLLLGCSRWSLPPSKYGAQVRTQFFRGGHWKRGRCKPEEGARWYSHSPLWMELRESVAASCWECSAHRHSRSLYIPSVVVAPYHNRTPRSESR